MRCPLQTFRSLVPGRESKPDGVVVWGCPRSRVSLSGSPNDKHYSVLRTLLGGPNDKHYSVLGTLLGGPNGKHYSVLGTLLGGPNECFGVFLRVTCFGKLPPPQGDNKTPRISDMLP